MAPESSLRSARGVYVAFDRTSRAEPAGPPAGSPTASCSSSTPLRFGPDAFPTCARTTIEQHRVHACPARGALVVIPAGGTVPELTWERGTPHYRRAGYRWALESAAGG
ncbi:hypothetical protein [Streptomyces acidicola]|uniref:Uncharacterized protein n=1 Tax=Streptomyces acidicola TaxID=2596892 RepID=A0A5N8WXP6_9ACTN|nr:hypothetical protein [Streptomyces acidicola]MPY51338.1 hypothetical protein [Streptomyces acidicola]